MCGAPRRACVGSIGHVWGLPGPLAWHSVSCSNICVMHAYPPWHVLSIRSCVLARLSTEPPCVMARPQGSIHSMGAHRLHPFILVRPGHGAGRGAAQGGGAGQVLAWWGHHRRWAQSSARWGFELAAWQLPSILRLSWPAAGNRQLVGAHAKSYATGMQTRRRHVQ